MRNNMKNKLHSILFVSAAFAFLIMCGAQAANAQATRTWVSGVGDDANPCSRTAPCKTFAGTISKTAAGGEINVIDAGGYGLLTINKSITINAVGFVAGISASGTNGITINAGATDIVRLRGLSIEGFGTGLNGINFLAGGQLIVEDCTINNFTLNGISMANAGTLNVRNTVITGSTAGAASGSAATGIKITAPGVTANIDNVRLQGLSNGLQVQSGSVASVSNSIITQNSTNGILAEGTSTVNASDMSITNNATGVQATGTATVRMSNLNIFNNTIGIARAAGGVLASFSNNKIAGNGTNGTPSAYLSNQ